MSLSALRTGRVIAGHTPVGLLAARLLLVLAVYTVVRAAFLVDHLTNFGDAGVSTLLWAFVLGARFDLSAIAYSNLPFILLSLAPGGVLARPWYQRALKALFVIVNGTIAIVMIADVAYYPFTGTRLTMTVFTLAGTATPHVAALVVNFAGHALIALSLAVAVWWLYPRHSGTPASYSRRRHAWLVAGAIALTVVAMRGGVQRKPLKPIHAFASGNHEVGVLTLNSVFTVLHSVREQKLEPIIYFADQQVVDSLVRPQYGYRGPTGQNVALVVLESMGTEFWGGRDREVPGLTPFLDSLSRHGVLFTNSFANGRRSMDAFSSILLGVPLYLKASLAESGYQANAWRGLGHFLEDAGYYTSMFHPAPEGTMYISAIAAMAGIRNFHSMERYPAELQRREFDGNWGLFDEPALQFAAEQIAAQPEPWFTTLFTISTHNPYSVPPHLRDSLPEGVRAVHQTVAYTDLALRRFFETVRTQPWFDRTLFIITGDHTPPMRSPRYDTALGRFMVPVLLYHPTMPLPPLDSARITQHVDLFQTVLDYAGVRPVSIPSFGRSIFASAEGEAVLTTDGVFWIARDEGVVERMPDGRERALAFQLERTGREPATLDAPDSASMSRKLHAYLQHFTTSMINNSFYREPASRPSVQREPVPR